MQENRLSLRCVVHPVFAINKIWSPPKIYLSLPLYFALCLLAYLTSNLFTVMLFQELLDVFNNIMISICYSKTAWFPWICMRSSYKSKLRTNRGVFRGSYLVSVPLPGSVKSMSLMRVLGPDGCWDLKKDPWKNSCISPWGVTRNLLRKISLIVSCCLF